MIRKRIHFVYVLHATLQHKHMVTKKRKECDNITGSHNEERRSSSEHWKTRFPQAFSWLALSDLSQRVAPAFCTG